MTNDLLYWWSFLLALVALTSQGAQANCIKALIGLLKPYDGTLQQGSSVLDREAATGETRGLNEVAHSQIPES